jgi:hypothetical protein
LFAQVVDSDCDIAHGISDGGRSLDDGRWTADDDSANGERSMLIPLFSLRVSVFDLHDLSSTSSTMVCGGCRRLYGRFAAWAQTKPVGFFGRPPVGAMDVGATKQWLLLGLELPQTGTVVPCERACPNAWGRTIFFF